MRVESDSPFSLEVVSVVQLPWPTRANEVQETNGTGEHAQQALVKKPAEKFKKPPFNILDFDFKIRKKIWTYVVQERRPFFFTCVKTFPEGRVQRRSVRKKVGGSPRASLALVQVSKQLENEAIPIVYGANIFAFDSASAMDHFFRAYLPMRRYIEHVQVVGMQGFHDVYSHTFWTM